MLITFEGKISQRLNNYTRSLTQFHTIICHLFAYPPLPLRWWRHLWTAPNIQDEWSCRVFCQQPDLSVVSSPTNQSTGAARVTTWVLKRVWVSLWLCVVFDELQHDSDLREYRFSRIFFDISLLNLDLESFLFHFHFSISISSHFYIFHFNFSKRVIGIKNSPFF